MEKKRIGLHFGLLADPIEKQLNDQGFTLGKDKEYEGHANSILDLWMENILTEKEKNKCLDRLFKRIIKHAKPLPDADGGA